MRRIVNAILVVLLLSLSSLTVSAQREPVTITFWNGWGGARIPLMEKMIADFEAQYPWIKVENQVIGLGLDRIEKLLLAVAAGSPPDVVMIDRVDIPNFVRKDVLMPLDSYIEADALDLDIFYESEIGSAQFEGRTWGLPIPTAGAKQLLFYNIDLLLQAGLSEGDVPTNWAELEEVARRLTRFNSDGSLEQLGFTPTTVPDAGWDYWLFSNGGRIISDDARTLLLHTPEAADTLEWLKSFVDSVAGGYENLQGFSGTFLESKRAMALEGSWRWYELRAVNPDMPMGIALPPAGPNGEPVNLVDRGWSYATPSGAQHPYESWLLIKYMTTHPDAACWFMHQQGRPSPVRACNQDPALFDTNPYMNVIGEALVRGYQIPISPIHSQLFDEIRKLAPRALLGEPIQGLLADAERRLQLELDQAWADL